MTKNRERYLAESIIRDRDDGWMAASDALAEINNSDISPADATRLSLAIEAAIARSEATPGIWDVDIDLEQMARDDLTARLAALRRALDQEHDEISSARSQARHLSRRP